MSLQTAVAGWEPMVLPFRLRWRGKRGWLTGGGCPVSEMVGKMVRGPSGRHLGRITLVTPKRICVDVAGREVWLPRDVIFSEEDEHVTVIFEPSGLDRYVVRGRIHRRKAC